MKNKNNIKESKKNIKKAVEQNFRSLDALSTNALLSILLMKYKDPSTLDNVKIARPQIMLVRLSTASSPCAGPFHCELHYFPIR